MADPLLSAYIPATISKLAYTPNKRLEIQSVLERCYELASIAMASTLILTTVAFTLHTRSCIVAL